MAAAWRGAWRSRVSSSSREPIRHPSHQRSLPPPQPDQLAEYIYNNRGMISSITASGTCTLSSSNTTYTTTTTSISSSSASALASRVLHPLMAPPNTTTTLLVEEDVEEEVGVHIRPVTEEEKAKTREHIRDLIHGSLGLLPTSGGDGTALDRWLWELQVSWVLHLAEIDDASARTTFVSRRLQHTARSWVLALHIISRSIVSFTGWWCSGQEGEEEAALQTTWPPASELAGFFAATLLQMLPFVDAVVALKIIDPSGDDHRIVSGSGRGVASAHKFQALTDVRDALSAASEQVQLWHSWLNNCSSSLSSEHAEAAARTSSEMTSLLLPKLDKLDEAIQDTRDHIRTQFMSLTRDDDLDSRAPGGVDDDLSPGIHKATKSAISYIIVLSTSYSRSAVNVNPPTVHEAAAAAPAAGDTNLIMVMIRSLEEKLVRVSVSSFPDQSLRYLFLINNFYFVWHQLRTNRLVDAPMYALTHKIDGYINSYMRVSWTPVLKPLHDHHTPRWRCCCTRYYSYSSAESKFKEMFEKTYSTQKLWKVPDPELREELRAAIIKKIIPAFTKFLEDNDASASRVTPKELEEMLEELFEG